MRKRDQEITDRVTIDDILRRCPVCHLGPIHANRLYVVPLCFGYDGHALYFHCADKGLKLDCLRSNPSDCAGFFLAEG